jgi:hypothetical protein
MEVNPDSIVVSFFDGEYVIRALDHGVVAAGATYAEAVAQFRAEWADWRLPAAALEAALHPPADWVRERVRGLGG